MIKHDKQNSILVFLFTCVFSVIACAESSVVGVTYSISERNALDEVKEKASKIPPDAFSPQKTQWSGLSPIPLPLAPKSETRSYVPWYTTTFDITNADGAVLYPKGYTFNPLVYAKLPQRIVAIREDQAVWFKENHHHPADMVLLTEGSVERVSKYLGSPVFVLDEPVKNRLGLRYSPSILKQADTQLLISEFSDIAPLPVPSLESSEEG